MIDSVVGNGAEPRCLLRPPKDRLFPNTMTRPTDPPKDAKVPCRTPAEGRDGVTNIPAWKFDAVRAAILGAVGQSGTEGLPFSALKDAVAERLASDTLSALGSLPWHVTTVKLELECRGELRRMPGHSPQRLHIPDQPSNAPHTI